MKHRRGMLRKHEPNDSRRGLHPRVQELKSDDSRVVASSIVGPPAADACDGTWYGSRYDTFSQASGLTENVCSDYGTIMEDLGERLIGPTRVFYLDYFAISDSIFVWIDGEELERSDTQGWNYDSEVAAIRFDGVFVPELIANQSITTSSIESFPANSPKRANLHKRRNPFS